MRKEALVVIILVCVAVGIFCGVPNVNADEDEIVATVIDTEGTETVVHDLYLYKRWCVLPGYPECIKYESSSKKSMLIEKGEGVSLTVPFNNIREMKFEWAETVENSIVTITALSGEKINGNPRYTSYNFEGKVDFGDFGFGDFSLAMKKTKKVIFSHEMMQTSPTLTPVTTTHTPTLTPTPSPTSTQASVPGPIPTPTTTPTTSLDQIPTPISRVPGFEVLFALVALLAVSLLTRKRRAK